MIGEKISTSLIICSRDRPEMVFEAVASILDGVEVPDELLVIDQSVKPNRRLLNFTTTRCSFRYVLSNAVGISRSRNLGVECAQYDVIVFTDDDVLVDPDWFGTIVQRLIDSGPKSVVTGRVLAGEEESEGAFAPSLHPESNFKVYRGRVLTDPLATFNFALHRSAHSDVGGFDTRIGPGTRFPSAEDNDFGYRLLKKAYSIVFDPRAIVRHRAWRRGNDYVATRYAYGRGQGAFYAKHLSQRDWYMLPKMAAAMGRRVRRMSKLDGRGLLGESSWIMGFFTAMTEWFLT